MAVTLCAVSTPGEEIRNARLALGWSQEKLAKAARVSGKTVGRVERGQDYKDPRSLTALRIALGLEAAPTTTVPSDPAAIAAGLPAHVLAAEWLRRVTAAEHVLDHARITRGDIPDDILEQENIIRGPEAPPGTERDQADG